ncbi:MAG: type II secretion system protein GspM [Sedimenticola sp.]
MNIREWFDALILREKLILVAGSLSLLLILLYSTLWQPLGSRVEALRSTVNTQKQQIAWMRNAVGEIQLLRQQVGLNLVNEGEEYSSLLTHVDQSAKALSMRSVITQVEPTSDNEVRVRLENAYFNTMVEWLVLLHEEGVVVGSVSLSSSGENGRVNGLVKLRKPAGGA